MPRTGPRSRGPGAGPRPPHHPVRDRFGDPGSLTLSLLPITARWFPTPPPSTAQVSMFRARCPTYPTPAAPLWPLDLRDRRRSAHSCMNPQAPASPRGRLTEIPQRPKALFSPVASWPRGPRSAPPPVTPCRSYRRDSAFPSAPLPSGIRTICSSLPETVSLQRSIAFFPPTVTSQRSVHRRSCPPGAEN